MKVVEHRIFFAPGDKFTLRHLTDEHLGHALCDERLLEADIKEIASDPNGLWLGGGDTGEFINRSDPRHRESSMASWLHGIDDIAGAQLERIVSLHAPIKEKCIGINKGNHEEAILQHYERDVYSALVNAISTPDRKVRLGAQGFVVLHWIEKSTGKCRWTTTLYATHGAGGGVLQGSDALALGRLPGWYYFDIAMLGHRHCKILVPGNFVEPNHKGNGVIQRKQSMFFGGTYLASFATNNSDTETYAEMRMLPPRGVGTAKVEFYPDNNGGDFKVIL